MARKSTTRPKVATVWLDINPMRRADNSRPHYRGTLLFPDGKKQDISLWIDAFVEGTPVPLCLSGEISEKKNG